MFEKFETLSRIEQEVVVAAPAAILVLVVNAEKGGDRVIGKREIDVLIELLESIDETEKDLFWIAASKAREEARLKKSLNRLRHENCAADILKAVSAVARLHYSPAEAETFFTALIDLGQEIAKNSGGLLGIFGSGIKKEERICLELIKGIFEAASAVKNLSELENKAIYSEAEKETFRFLEEVIFRKFVDKSATFESPVNKEKSREKALVPFEVAKDQLVMRMIESGDILVDEDWLYAEKLKGFSCLICLREDKVGSQKLEKVTKSMARDWKKSEEELFRQAIENSFEEDTPVIDYPIPDPEYDGSLRILPCKAASPSKAFSLERYPPMIGFHGAIVGIPNTRTVISLPIDSELYFRLLPSLQNTVQDFYEDETFTPITQQLFLWRNKKLFPFHYSETTEGIQIDASESPTLFNELMLLEEELFMEVQ